MTLNASCSGVICMRALYSCQCAHQIRIA